MVSPNAVARRKDADHLSDVDMYGGEQLVAKKRRITRAGVELHPWL